MKHHIIPFIEDKITYVKNGEEITENIHTLFAFHKFRSYFGDGYDEEQWNKNYQFYNVKGERIGFDDAVVGDTFVFTSRKGFEQLKQKGYFVPPDPFYADLTILDSGATQGSVVVKDDRNKRTMVIFPKDLINIILHNDIIDQKISGVFQFVNKSGLLGIKMIG